MTSLFSMQKNRDRSACGVGFVARRDGRSDNDTLAKGLCALSRIEHRGACGADGVTGDGSGIMTDIPYEILGVTPGTAAVATLFLPLDINRRRSALAVFEDTFRSSGLTISRYRDVPVRPDVLGHTGRETLPFIIQAIVERPEYCVTDASFDRLLYSAKQRAGTIEKERGIQRDFFFVSLSSSTIIYKALCQADKLSLFYPDLLEEKFCTRFVLYHRRFSTNTTPSWDKAQPFRVIAHNGEINTIAGNRAWSASREKSLGVPSGEVVTAEGISDSGTLNEVVEALRYRSSIPSTADILAIMVPPAAAQVPYYQFWSRAMEPWDGPAFLAFSDGGSIGARMDRNGFRPCRWSLTSDYFYLASEAGSFDVPAEAVLRRGALNAGCGVSLNLQTGEVKFDDSSVAVERYDAHFDARFVTLTDLSASHSSNGDHGTSQAQVLTLQHLFGYTKEDIDLFINPMAEQGKEPIGSMGDTAALAILSNQDRAIFDFFSHDFAQVTNPPFDYLREDYVTEMHSYLGRKPNIFEPNELIPPPRCIMLDSPVLSLEEFAIVTDSTVRDRYGLGDCGYISLCFNREHGEVGYREALRRVRREALELARAGCSAIVLTDHQANADTPAVSSLLALRGVITALDGAGIRLHSSVIVHTGEVRTTHHVACLVGFGATAVCPYLALSTVYRKSESDLVAVERMRSLKRVFEQGLLKIMSKMGVSVLRSYEGSELFTPVGLGPKLIAEYFPKHSSPIGGVEIDFFARQALQRIERCHEEKLSRQYSFKEHTQQLVGERHAMTNKRARAIQDFLKESSGSNEANARYEEYLESGRSQEPTALRHLLRIVTRDLPDGVVEPESIEEITARFGSGAMSFGSLSARAQRDIFVAMQMLGGRSNSGEGGENPFYFSEGVCASTKQVASGRFGVNAEYLASAEEIQIKIAQGAKPGEGGQLMGTKVSLEIARARHASPGTDLISPPPLHDIYSIEDLKQLIYELKQFKPNVPVNVKLVSGSDIGTIAVGVVKAGADVIHIAGFDGGTGAAPLSSMKHAGLPWELGLVEAHQALLGSSLRSFVRLRVDGGLHSGEDVVKAALLGAEEFDFGKLLLVAEGCIMARICEKNTCPTGIATQDPKFLAKYKGSPERVVQVLRHLASEVQQILGSLGVRSLGEIIGRTDLLEPKPSMHHMFAERGIDLGRLLQTRKYQSEAPLCLLSGDANPLNREVAERCASAIRGEGVFSADFSLTIADRAISATLVGLLGQQQRDNRRAFFTRQTEAKDTRDEPFRSWSDISLNMKGSAGQGFGVFLVDGVRLTLEGEANDSVGKGMSGGLIAIKPPVASSYDPRVNTIVGNCALYGATGGTFFAYGRAGDRFGVRNSGALAVVEGVGLHACEYMTAGKVIILGRTSANIGAGMTGGELYVTRTSSAHVRQDFLLIEEVDEEKAEELREILLQYRTIVARHETDEVFESLQWIKDTFLYLRPRGKTVVFDTEMRAA